MSDPAPMVLEMTPEGIAVHLRGRTVRFPQIWGKKFAAWLREGRSRNIVCNTDIRKFNLLGATRAQEGCILTYLEGDKPQALLLGPRHLDQIVQALAGENRGQNQK